MERLMEAAGDCKLGRICNLMRLHQAHYKVVCFTPEGFGPVAVSQPMAASGIIFNEGSKHVFWGGLCPFDHGTNLRTQVGGAERGQRLPLVAGLFPNWRPRFWPF